MPLHAWVRAHHRHGEGGPLAAAVEAVRLVGRDLERKVARMGEEGSCDGERRQRQSGETHPDFPFLFVKTPKDYK